jgi:hypothetical protein
MMITLDPTELIAVSETLRTCSNETGDIGSQLWACAQCAMPPDLQAVVDQLVVAVDRALASVGTQLLVQALDLTRRALIAVNDSQTATMTATSSASGPAVAAEAIFGGTMVIGGTNPAGGWAPFDTMTIGGPADALTTGWLDPMNTTVSTIGGPADSLTTGWLDPMNTTVSTIGGPADSISTTGWLDPMNTTTMVIGAPDYSSGPMSGIMALAEASDRMTARNQAAINAIVSDPNSSAYALKVAMNVQDSIGDNMLHQLAPSRQSLDDAAGYHLTDGEVMSISPNTLPKPFNILYPS